MGGENIVTQTLAILIVISHVGFAGKLPSFTKENYPDPRVQFQACNRPRASWVCDPGQYLSTEQADEIDRRINLIPRVGSVNAITVGIVPRIVTADGSETRSMLGLREFTNYQFQNIWSKYARSTIVIVYHISRNEVWTQSSTNMVSAICICQAAYETRHYLIVGDVGTVLDVFTQKFTDVLSGKATCSLPSTNIPFRIDSTGICTWDREITISSFSPDTGPPEGGAKVTIRGQNLDLSSGNLLIGTIICQLTSRTPSEVTCRTSPVQNPAHMNTPLPVYLLLNGRVQYNTGHKFVYISPTLSDVQPRTTIVSGGLQLTVSGTNLNLVTSASMKTVLKGTRTGRTAQFTTECQIRNSTSMLCPTPKLDIKAVGSQLSKRRVGNYRAAREVGDDDASIAVENVEMKVTFSINGKISPLQNGQPAPVVPYADPVLYPFKDEQRILTFISVWPKSERMVDIKGTGLMPALKGHTLNIGVGAAFCNMKEMATNLLVCNPPIMEPEKKESRGQHPVVMVHVGNQQFDIGYLQYYDTLWKYPPTRYAIIGLAGALLLVLLVLVLCCYTRNKRRKDKQNTKN